MLKNKPLTIIVSAITISILLFSVKQYVSRKNTSITPRETIEKPHQHHTKDKGIETVIDKITNKENETLIEFHLTSEGQKINDFIVSHEKLIHTILVSNDLNEFNHLHPEIKEDGSLLLSVPKNITTNHLLYNQFESKNLGYITTKYFINTNSKDNLSLEIKPDADIKVNYNFKEENGNLKYSLDLYKNNIEITADKYLGARGHSIIINVDSKNIVHTHAEKESLQFETSLSKGIYKIFTQYKVGDKIYLTEKIIKI